MSPEFQIVRALGVRVVECHETLPHPAIYCAVMGIAFVSAGLTPQERQETADQLLAAYSALCSGIGS